MNKWIVLSFVIPEVLVLGSIIAISPLLTALGAGPGMSDFFLYGFICALVPGTTLCGIISIYNLFAVKPEASR